MRKINLAFKGTIESFNFENSFMTVNYKCGWVSRYRKEACGWFIGDSTKKPSKMLSNILDEQYEKQTELC